MPALTEQSSPATVIGLIEPTAQPNRQTKAKWKVVIIGTDLQSGTYSGGIPTESGPTDGSPFSS